MTNQDSIGETSAQTPIHFGTDGWRGRMAEDYTFANVRRCAQGFANWLADEGHADKAVVVGHDKRFQGEHFAAAVAEVLAGNGFRVLLIEDAAPTPVISFAAVDRDAVGAVNITASHNPPRRQRLQESATASGAALPPARAWSKVEAAASPASRRRRFARTSAQRGPGRPMVSDPLSIQPQVQPTSGPS